MSMGDIKLLIWDQDKTPVAITQMLTPQATLTDELLCPVLKDPMDAGGANGHMISCAGIASASTPQSYPPLPPVKPKDMGRALLEHCEGLIGGDVMAGDKDKGKMDNSNVNSTLPSFTNPGTHLLSHLPLLPLPVDMPHGQTESAELPLPASTSTSFTTSCSLTFTASLVASTPSLSIHVSFPGPFFSDLETCFLASLATHGLTKTPSSWDRHAQDPALAIAIAPLAVMRVRSMAKYHGTVMRSRSLPTLSVLPRFRSQTSFLIPPITSRAFNLSQSACGDIQSKISLLQKAPLVALPSATSWPVTAQRYCVEILYEGPMDSASAIGIHDCNPNSPLVLYVSEMVTTSDKACFYAFGHVFSRIIKSRLKICIQGPNYLPRKKDDLFVKTIQHTVLMTIHCIESIEDCPAGNIVSIVSINQVLLKSGTLTISKTAHNMRIMRLSVSPVVQIAIEVRNDTDLPKLVEGLRCLFKFDLCVQAWICETGGIVASAGEPHLEICLKDLQEDLAGVPLKISNPIVRYHKTIKTESLIVTCAKSQNKHKHLFVKAMPLDEELTKVLNAGKISGGNNFKLCTCVLADEHSLDITDAGRIWCFGPGYP